MKLAIASFICGVATIFISMAFFGCVYLCAGIGFLFLGVLFSFRYVEKWC